LSRDRRCGNRAALGAGDTAVTFMRDGNLFLVSPMDPATARRSCS
jgi:hypothetical protein